MKQNPLKSVAAFIALPALLIGGTTAVAEWNGRGDALKVFGVSTGSSVQQMTNSTKAPVATSPRQKAPAEQSSFNVVGLMVTNGDYDSPRIASFGVGGDFNFETLQTENVSDLTRGGFYTPDGFYYAFSPRKIAKFDTSNWGDGIVSTVDLQRGSLGFPKAATYDMTTGKVYACFENEENAWFQSYWLCSVDIETGEVTKLIALPGEEKGQAYGMAADAHGDLYMILKYDSANPYAYYPALYKVDLNGNKLNYIGNTNINLSGYYTGAAFDFDSGRLYFMSDAMFKAALNEIDLTTGAGTQTLLMPNNEQFCGIYIPYTQTATNAPARLTDLALTFSDASGNGTLSFTLPNLTYGGETLSDNVEYTATCNGKTLTSGTAQAGSKITEAVSVPGEGAVTINVTLKGGPDNNSCENSLDTWVGNDNPAEPEAVVVSAQVNELTVKWQAPTIGIHGGYIDPAALTYNVVLQPSGEVIASNINTTSFTKTLNLSGLEKVYAEVTADYNGLTGATATSNVVVAGPALTLPYVQDFSSPDSFGLFTVVDVDGDGATWKRYSDYSEAYAMCDYSADNAKNDWLFTPSLHLETGIQYTFSFKASSLMVMAHPEILEVMMGKAASVEGMTITLLSAEKVNNKVSWTWFDYSFQLNVEETGDYNIGFHALSEADRYILAIDDIRIEGTPFNAPAPVTDCTVVPAADGSLSATLTFSTPTNTNNGDPLDNLTNAEIYVNNRLTSTIENPEVGTEYPVTFETIEGLNSVAIYTTNEAGKSSAYQTSVFTGPDSPAAPGNIRAKVTDEGILITWETPKGEHGGTINPEELSYAIGRYINGEVEILTLDLENENSYLDEYTTEYQTVVTYGIAASNSIGNGPTGTSNCIIIGGEISTLPFAESFANNFASYLWQNQVVDWAGTSQWRLFNTDYDGNVPTADNDNGCLVFHPNQGGDKTRIFSGLMSLAPAQHPVLEFWYKGNNSQGQILKVEANTDMTEWDTIASIELDGSENEWKQVKLPLDTYKTAGCFQIAFQGVAANESYIYVDRISIRDVKENDLSVALSTRKNFYYGTSEKISAAVSNIGEKPAASYLVEFYADDTLLSSIKASDLQPDGIETFSIDHALSLGDSEASEVVVKVIYDADENLENNMDSSTTRNHLPLYPAPRDFMSNGSDIFAWSEPEEWVEPEAITVTDTFDDYETFIIDEIGDWTVVDENGEMGTFPILGFNYPYLGSAKSWQVFDLRALGITPEEDDTSWDGHSGTQFLLSFPDLDRKNDDWLISPVLTGDAQEISFWAKSINTFWYGNEEFEVLASSNGKELSDFTVIEKGDVGAEWTEITVALPEGTKYFAIKCTSADKYMLALDDITYTPGTGMPDDFKLLGYNFYKNGAKVNDDIITDRHYNCPTAEGDLVAVTAVYTTGESRFAQFMGTNGIENVTQHTSASVSVDGDNILIRGAKGMEVNVASVDGTVLLNTLADSDLMIPVTAGIYIVRTGNVSTKVIVR